MEIHSEGTKQILIGTPEELREYYGAPPRNQDVAAETKAPRIQGTKRHNKPWTTEEDELVKKAMQLTRKGTAKRGAAYRKLSRQLDRTGDTIRQRAHGLLKKAHSPVPR